MTNLSSILDTFSSLESTWGKVRADVWSHLLTGTLLFALVGVPLPFILLPSIDPDALIQDPWFKLAKGAGLLFLLPVVLAVIILVYVLILRAVGRFVVLLVSTFWPPRQLGVFEIPWVSEESLITIALTLNTTLFDRRAFDDRLSQLVLKYQIGRKADLQAALDDIQGFTRASYTYFANTAFFLVVWLVTFVALPSSSTWKHDASRYFLTGTVVLVTLLLWARFRFANGLPMQLMGLVTIIAALVASDADFKRPAKSDAQLRQAVRDRVLELRRKATTETKDPVRVSLKQWLKIQAKILFSLVRYYFRGGF